MLHGKLAELKQEHAGSEKQESLEDLFFRLTETPKEAAPVASPES